MKRFAWVSLSLALATGLAACRLPLALAGAGSGAPLPTGDPRSTATQTPFIPLPPTATLPPSAFYTPTASPTPVDPWESFPAPAESSATEIPRPYAEIEVPDGVLNIALLGSDERSYQGGYRTDALVIVSLNPQDNTITLLSIPRDLYVYVPGWRMDRINTAEPHGGFEMLRQTILYNFGIPIHHWARVNFSGFINGIDALGGIDVEITGYLYDECGGTWYSFSSGTTRHMDGWTAHCYVRMRKNSGDYDRMRRQQEVLRAIFSKIVSLDGLSRVPELYSQFSRIVQTDIDLATALPFVPLAAAVASGSGTMQSFAIDSTMVTAWRVPSSGAAVVLPDREAIQALIRTAFGT